MGLYVQCFSALPATTQTKKFSISVEKSARRWAELSRIGALFFAGPATETGVWISCYPGDEGIQFDVENDRVSFGLKTSIIGPGYHKAIIDLCDFLSKELGLEWRWDAGGDETGYALDRDFKALKRVFVQQFWAFCEYINEPSSRHKNLNLAIGMAVEDFDGTGTPMGILPATFFHDALESEDDETDEPAHLFPWWSPEIDDRFWISAVRTMLWAETEWRAPQSEWESHIHAAIFFARDRLGEKLDHELRAAALELEQCVRDTKPPVTGAFVIGWRRRMRYFQLSASWLIKLPGYHIEATEDDGETHCLWLESEEIRTSAFVAEATVGRTLEWSKDFQNCPEFRATCGGECIYRLTKATRAEQYSTFFIAQAEFRASHGDKAYLLFLTVVDSNPKLFTRLKEVAAAVQFVPPRNPPSALHLS